MKVKKIFLGGYINYINAQNINCKSIATHLNKNKYSVRALILGKNNIPHIKGVDFYRVSPFLFSLSNTVAFIRGVLWADVCYMPKHQSTPKIALKIAVFFRKKLFTTIEGNMWNTSIKSMIDSFGSKQKMKKYFRHFPNIFGITKKIVDESNSSISLNRNPLYLGVEQSYFNNNSKKKSLKNIVFVGTISKRKRVDELIKLSKKFPNLNFHIIGDGIEKYKLEKFAKKNVIFYGKINHLEIQKLYMQMDLHVLLSRSEGFPKVILETASSSIPSIVYDDYGAHEWIKTNENGFVLSKYSDVVNKLLELIENPYLLKSNSEGAYIMSKKFDWKNLIKNWEQVIENLK